jgi:rifampicin phosphotransferase
VLSAGGDVDDQATHEADEDRVTRPEEVVHRGGSDFSLTGNRLNARLFSVSGGTVDESQRRIEYGVAALGLRGFTPPTRTRGQRNNERLARDRHAAIQSAHRSAGWPKRKLLDRALQAAALYTPAREATKSALIKAVYEARVGLVALARRADVPGDDIFFVTEPELESFLSEPAPYAETITSRRSQRQALAERTPPFWFTGEMPNPTTWELRVAPVVIAGPGTTLRGLGVSTGRVTGTARVLADPNDPLALEPGDILVAPDTDPAWTPLFLIAAGVVVNVGAQTSHAATIARELGIPAVVGVSDATRQIPIGARITIDGTTGTVDIE